MKFLEGKSQAERKKIITAIALGAVTICALFYTFVLSGGGRSSANANNRNNSNRATANSNLRNSNNSGQQISQIDQPSMDETLLTPIPDNPFPPISDGAVSRNIFAFYEPPPFVPKPSVIPTEKPPSPTPVPTPLPFFAAAVNPGMVYAQTGNFNLEVGGDKFTPDSRIYFGGMELQTQFVNPQRLTAQVPAQLISSEGEREIVVRVPSDPKMYSNPVKINVQAPPVPEFNFVGLVARRRANNDTALLQNKKTKEYISVRLNDTVPDRFRVFSISSREVVVMDTALKLRHVLGFVNEKDAPGGNNTGGNAPGGREGIRGRTNQPNPNYNPNVPNVPNVQYQSIP
ncbi:MAG TPA: IPT/TIG domain-containing protein, partial [Pyrinomonadaceae bacterium]|nr:IPT/TIG domain-containing protein [Pyrinomonadaceae bacterium]